MTFTPGRADAAPCQGDCLQFIVATGEIGPDSVAHFAALWARLPRKDVPLILHSPGGRLDGALALGRALRQLGVAVDVATRRPLGAGPDGLMRYGAAEAGTCQSACVYAFAGGVQRSLAPGSTLGVHQFYVARAEDASRRPKTRYSARDIAHVQRTTADLAAYLTEMRIDLGLLTLAADVDPSRIRTLETGEVAALNLTTRAAAPTDAAAQPAPALRPAIGEAPPAAGWPVVTREGRPWLVLRAESPSRRFGSVFSEIAIGCRAAGPDYVASFREIAPPGRAASGGSARFATGSGGGVLAALPGTDALRGTISRDAALAAVRAGALELEVVSIATAHYPMRVAFPGEGLRDGIDRLDRACATH